MMMSMFRKSTVLALLAAVVACIVGITSGQEMTTASLDLDFDNEQITPEMMSQLRGRIKKIQDHLRQEQAVIETAKEMVQDAYIHANEITNAALEFAMEEEARTGINYTAPLTAAREAHAAALNNETTAELYSRENGLNSAESENGAASAAPFADGAVAFVAAAVIGFVAII